MRVRSIVGLIVPDPAPVDLGQELALNSLEMSAAIELSTSTHTAWDLVSACRASKAARFPAQLSADECARLTRAVYGARSRWTANFSGVQFTLGRAWYTHFEEDREDSYFDDAAASDATVEAAIPGLQERLLGLVGAHLGAPVTRRPGWCGPGVHIFPAGSQVARRGGEVHFDTEGLSDDQLALRLPSLSFVLMLQVPEAGGGLRLWDRFYEGEDFPAEPGPHVRSLTVSYAPGELVAFDAYRLHQIQPFRGERDRISATVHVLQEGGRWQAWF
jgi:hypothetical protein